LGFEEAVSDSGVKPIPSIFDGSKVKALGFYKGEKASGFNNICYCDDLGSPIAITISSTDLCPCEEVRS